MKLLILFLLISTTAHVDMTDIFQQKACEENPETAWYGECYKENTAEDYQEKLDYIIEYTEGNMEFLFTLVAENGALDPFVKHWNTNGSYDVSVCQLNSQWHYEFIGSEEFKDWRNQVHYCYGVWNDAWKKNRIYTTFYAYPLRYSRSKSAGLVCNY